jgi:hypothetical protein
MAPAAGESRENRPARPAGFTAADLAADLRGLGVRAGEALIVHSSMKSIARRMQRIGLCDVQTHDFPVSAWEPGFSRFQALVDGRWEEIPSAPAAHSPSTGGRTREGRTVQLESLADLDKLPDRRGAVAVLWDGCGRSLADFRRLMNAGFLGLVAVDTRYTHDELVATGVPSRWVPDFRTPMISLPHPQAVRLFGRRPVACRLKVDGRVAPGRSTVVTGEIPGTQPGVILLSGHHDTTFNSAAPDDNLSGVATVLQVAALLLRSKLRPRWTLRFCSFGAEEQLSEGARWCAFESGLAGPVRFVLNTDSAGSRCGTTGIYVTGDAELTGWLRRQARRAPLQLKIIEELCPFSDQFPFNCQGVPSLWFYRQTTAAGRHYHHTVRDTLAEISLDQLARLAEFQAALVRQLSRRAEWPFRRRFPPPLKKEVAAARKRWFG